jgi:NAD(P)-dependent dehydrogenase (short-subunit alcohol dehydrogenase family)
MATNPWYSLAGKNIWITGGAGYFGSVLTSALDVQCGQVVCFDLGNRAAGLVKAQGLSRTVPLAHNLSDPATLPTIIDAAVRQHGLPDGVVHLSYASHGAGQGVGDLPAAIFQKTIEQNLTPTFLLCRDLGERMKSRRSGSIVLFSSMYGMVAPDPEIYHPPMKPNSIDYGASKAAVIQMTRYFAVHYGPEALRFNCVSPGPFPHPGLQAAEPGFIDRLAGKTALHRIGRNTEMVGPALFLLSDSASYITGHNLVVDGGWTTW